MPAPRNLTEADVRTVAELVKMTGFDHISAEDVVRVASAKELYNFDALRGTQY